MFEYRNIGKQGKYDSGHIAIDNERDVSLHFVRGFSGEQRAIAAYKLIWEGRVIPFDLLLTPDVDRTIRSKREVRSVYRFEFFGSGRGVSEGIARYEFKNEEERNQAMILAVEAYLVFATNGRMLFMIDKIAPVEHNGKLFHLNDFDQT